MKMIEQNTRAASTEAMLAMWRMAADVVVTDSVAPRRQAYQEIIAVVCQQLQSATTIGAIMVLFGRGELHAIAIREALIGHGKVLNAEVIVAAACWQRLCALLAQQRDAGVA
jgi:hypothetical protein